LIFVKRTVRGEAYWTAPGLAQRCVDFAADVLSFDRFELLIDPSAGRGAFLTLLPADKRIAVDISPQHPEVRRGDFLSWAPPRALGPTLTIGNPPFGQRGALAMAFIVRAAAYSEAFAFVLPRSFNKYTFQNRVPPQFHLLGSFDCDEFCSEDGRPKQVRAVFQVWERRDQARPRIEPDASHPHFEMRHRHLSRTPPDAIARLREDFAFAIAQVGSDFRPKDVAALTRGSHWFIKPLVPGVRRRFDVLDFGFLENMNTAHTSLSKRDIVRAYRAVLDAGL
jgi:hypothetical protein